MSTPDFLVVFRGATLDSFEQQSVQTQVEAALRLTEDQSGKLFSGKLVVIKRTQDKTDALTLAQQLKKLGADVSVRVAPKPDAAQQLVQPPAPPLPTQPRHHTRQTSPPVSQFTLTRARTITA